MPGASGGRRGALLYLLAWLLLGAALGGAMVAAAGIAWPNALIFAIPVMLAYAVGAGFSAYYLCRAYPLAERTAAGILLALGASATITSLLWSAACQGWNSLCMLAGVAWAGIPAAPQLPGMLFGLGLLLYGLLAAMNYAAAEFERASSAERRALEARVTAQDAELCMLRTQIDPHFLFNSLNSISALTSQDPRGAREMTLRLAGFFRASLCMEAHRKVALSQELAMIRHFLAIEKVRFGERLQLDEVIEDDAADCLVPPMIIQPLVENAVKHGVAGLMEGGWIRVTARRTGSQLRIVVENAMDPDPVPKTVEGHGIGLANVRQRLAAAYGTEAAVHWTSRGDAFGVEMTLPAETAPAANVAVAGGKP